MNKPTLIKNSKIMRDLKTALCIEYNKERDGIHVSDILLCQRETVFRRLYPQEIKDVEIGFFTVGRAIHEAIQQLAKYFPKYEVEKEINYEIDGITLKAHIDLYDKENNIPIEAKTVRSNKVSPTDEPKDFNVDQLKMYMSLVDADTGYLIYQLMLDYNDFPFRVYEIKMTKEERKEMLENMVTDALNLQMNIDMKTPEKSKYVFYDESKKWKCKYCHFTEQCQDMRNIEYVKTRKV
jgi:CRISPR/Cas system-associated exonuclease Cas4 (RecB family)